MESTDSFIDILVQSVLSGVLNQSNVKAFAETLTEEQRFEVAICVPIILDFFEEEVIRISARANEIHSLGFDNWTPAHLDELRFYSDALVKIDTATDTVTDLSLVVVQLLEDEEFKFNPIN